MIQPGRVDARFFLVSIALGAVILLFDLSLPLGVAGGVPYVAFVLIGLWTPGQRYVLGLAAIATALTVFGYLYSSSGSAPWVVLTNRTLAVFAIWITALLIAYRKQAEVQLRKLSRAVEAKQAEQDLQKKDELIRAIVDNSPNEIVVKDLAGQLLLVNRKFEELSGVAREDALGKTFSEIFSGGIVENALDHEREVLRAGQSITRENELSIDGDIRTFLVCHFLVPDPAGIAVAIGSISLDITERKQLERRRHHAEKMEALGVLVGGIAHEINNMVFAIVGLTESVTKSLPDGSEDRAALDGVLEAGERCKDLARQISAFSRQDEPEICVIDLSGMIGAAHRLVRATLPATIELRWDLDEACGLVLADPTQIHQVLLNLASNAADAMWDQKGALLEISLDRVELDDDRTSRVLELGPGPYARLAARDNGCGMDGDTLDRIFDPFFTTKAVGGGMGMGLAVVHGIVTGLGGVIAVSSEVGRGTRFEIYLPIVDGREAGRHAQAARSLAASA